MLQYSIYSVISPEGCASILWKSADKAQEAAQSLGIDSKRLKELGLIDRIIDEPLGGAHRDYDDIAKRLKLILIEVILKKKRYISMNEGVVTNSFIHLNTREYIR